ncbi:MAG: SRPBCC family protein [Acidobacteriota bacterium]|jgi:ligand-binding SRPBCC domain-containing protein
MFTLETETRITAPLAEVWPFFCDARNLERLTPSFLRFEVLTPDPIEMHVGTRIDYKLKVRGVPLRWQSEITAWEPPYRFVDEQRRGPYRVWIHEHTFEEAGNNTIARDHVRYDHIGGRLVNALMVGPDVRRIFAYREKALQEIFGVAGRQGA